MMGLVAEFHFLQKFLVLLAFVLGNFEFFVKGEENFGSFELLIGHGENIEIS